MFTTILIAIFALLIGFLAFYSYILYRIMRKFDNTVSYLEMLIPFWNVYIFYRTTLGKPLAYYCFWGFLTFVILVYISNSHTDDKILALALGLLGQLVGGTPNVLVAENLGKNFWIYFALFLVVPVVTTILDYNAVGFLIHIVIMLKLAFDNSKPSNKPSGVTDISSQ